MNTSLPEVVSEEFAENIEIFSIFPDKITPLEETVITIKASSLNNQAYVVVENCTTIWTNLTSEDELEVKLLPDNVPGRKELKIYLGIDEDKSFADAIAVVAIPTGDNYSSLGWLLLDNTRTLNISSDSATNPDVLHKNNIAIQRGSNGIFLNGTGYMAFPRLAWNASEEQSVEFTFDWRGDRNSNLYFGLVDDSYNLNNSTASAMELGIQFYRNLIYYLFSRHGSISQFYYYRLASNVSYKLRISDNGKPNKVVQLYLVEEEKGEVKEIPFWRLNVPLNLNFRESIGKLTPMIIGTNKTSPVTGIRVL